MKITKVTARKTSGNSKIVGMASITLDNCFVVGNIKICQGANGLFISMPSYKDAKGEYKDICFPVTKDFREEIRKSVLDKFNEAGSNTSVDDDDSDDELPF